MNTALLIDARAMRDHLIPVLRGDPLVLLTAHARAAYERDRAGPQQAVVPPSLP